MTTQSFALIASIMRCSSATTGRARRVVCISIGRWTVTKDAWVYVSSMPTETTSNYYRCTFLAPPGGDGKGAGAIFGIATTLGFSSRRFGIEYSGSPPLRTCFR